MHATHGVSRYAGTKMMEGADGRSEEYFQLEYADGHRVFVPVEHVARLTKHVGDAEIATAIGRMESSEQLCRTLLEMALQGGGSDNITILAGRVRRAASP